jgi:hypothetical protein
MALSTQVVAVMRGAKAHVVTTGERFLKIWPELVEQSGPLGFREWVLDSAISLDCTGETIGEKVRPLLYRERMDTDVSLAAPTEVTAPRGSFVGRRSASCHLRSSLAP